MEIQVPVTGMAASDDLIMHRFGPKARKMMEDIQAGKARNKKEKRDPKSEFLEAMYVASGNPGEKGCVYGMPAAAFKKCIVSACRFVDGLTMVLCRGALFVISDARESRDGTELVTIKTSKVPHMRTDTVRLPNGSTDLRYRPGFDKWSAVVTVQYNTNVITPGAIINLMTHAGFSVGVGDDRPERQGNNHGRFDVDLKKIEMSA